MAFDGPTYSIPFDKGGLSYNRNIDQIKPYMFVEPSKNINVFQYGREKRGGTAKVSSTAISGSPQILGGINFRVGAQSYIVTADSNGKIMKDRVTELKAGMSATAFYNFCVFDNELYVCDGASNVQTWDGSAGTTSDLTDPAADWATTKPFQMIAHGRGASRRLWALAGNSVYYSNLGNGKDFNGGTAGKIAIAVADAYGLVGGIEFGNRLIVWDRLQAYIIDDSSTSTAEWGYEKAQWKGGLAHWRLIVETDNDILAMAEDGQFYSVSGAQEYGDYRKASLMRDAFIDVYFRSIAAMASIDKFHAVYDRLLRAVKIFFVRAGQTEVDSALVFFVDRGTEEGWALHDNQDSASGYSASCSFEARVSAGTYLIYTGDYSGFLWKLEQSTRSDDSSAYYGGFKTPILNLDNPRMRKHFRRLWLILEAVGNYDLQIKIWVDGVNQTSQSVSMGSSGTQLGSFILNTSTLGGQTFTDVSKALNFVGKRIQFEFYNSNAAQTFFLGQMMIDYNELPATV